MYAKKPLRRFFLVCTVHLRHLACIQREALTKVQALLLELTACLLLNCPLHRAC